MTDQENFVNMLKNQKEGVWDKEEFISWIQSKLKRYLMANLKHKYWD